MQSIRFVAPALPLLFLLAGAASAQDYAVRGERLAGRATLREGRVELSLFGDGVGGAKRGGSSTLVAAVERLDSGGLRLRYTVSERKPVLRGAVDWIRDPSWSRDAWRPVVRELTSELRPVAGGFEGEVAGFPQRWTERDPGESNWTVLVVPGLSTNNWNEVGIPYLDENLAALEARGLKARRVAIKTEDGVAKNAAFLGEEIRREAAAGRQVVVLAHSKGGTDITAALALQPELRPHVVGVVAVQPVYGGSYVADLVASNKPLRGSMALVFEKVFKGQRDAVLDLTHTARAEFVAAHPYPADEIPTVVVRSSFSRRFSRSVLWPPEKYITARHAVPNDGLVSVEDQRIPGAARELFLDDLDHFEPGVRVESAHKPVDVTNRGLDALLEVLAERRARNAEGAPRIGRPLGR